MESVNRVFITNLKRLRREHDITQETLAEMIDASNGYIGRIESESVSPSFKMVDRIARALEVSVYELFLPADLQTVQESVLKERLIDDIGAILDRYRASSGDE